jgi:hypothetical protein
MNPPFIQFKYPRHSVGHFRNKFSFVKRHEPISLPYRFHLFTQLDHLPRITGIWKSSEQKNSEISDEIKKEEKHPLGRVYRESKQLAGLCSLRVGLLSMIHQELPAI